MRNVVMGVCLALGASALSAQDVPTEVAPLEAAPEPSPPAAPTEEPARDAALREAARAELTTLVDLVRHAPDDPRWPRSAMGLRNDPPDLPTAESEHPAAVVAARLLHFEARFGIAPRELDDWAAMQAAARHALAELKERGHGVSPAQVWTRSFLEYASDDLVAAEHTLFGDAPRVRARDCPYHAEESYAWLSAARAVMTELLDLPGERVLPYHAAFHYFRCDESAEIGSRFRVAADLVLARYAQLLAEHDEWAAFSTVRAQLVEHRLDSIGEVLVRGIEAPSVPAEGERHEELFTVWTGVEDSDPDVDWIAGGGYAFVVGDREVRASWRPLGFSVRHAPGRDPEDLGDAEITDFRVVAPDDPRAAVIARALREREGLVDFARGR